MRLSEEIGRVLGRALAPFLAAGSRARHGRVFHPHGVVLRAHAEATVTEGPLGSAARRLEGPVLARLSTAIWRNREWKDVLGLALRFRSDPAMTPEPGEGDQDLLFVTIRLPITTPFAPLTTHAHDFLDNDYYAVSPFLIPELGRVRLRVRCPRVRAPGETREARLRAAVEQGVATLSLEVKPEGQRAYVPFVALHLLARVELDQEALRFWPYRNGREIVPHGFVHAMRIPTYARSQRARGEQRRKDREEDRRQVREAPSAPLRAPPSVDRREDRP